MQSFYSEDDNESNQQSNYPIENDDSFTPDQIDEITSYKERANAKIAKNESILKGLEAFFWGISSYSLCRWLVLNLGSSGINLAFAVALIFNQISNRDCLDSFNLNKNSEGWEITGMNKAFKFAFGVGASLFVAWASIGNFIGMVNDSKMTYNILNEQIENFNSLPPDKQQEGIQVAVMSSVAVSLLAIAIGVNRK